MLSMDNIMIALIALITALVIAGIGIFMSLRDNKTNQVFESPCGFQTPHRRIIIDIVDTVDKCKRAVNEIKMHCRSYNVVGLDCEWLEENLQQSIQLLQIATHEGYCALFRLRQMRTIPQCLSDLLKDRNIIKVGVGIHRDTVHLKREFDLTTNKFLDLTFFAVLMNRSSGTLKELTLRILDGYLRKNKNLSRSDWRSDKIQIDRIQYAAQDAIAGIEIFKKLAGDYSERGGYIFDRSYLEYVLRRLVPYFDQQYVKYYHDNLLTWF